MAYEDSVAARLTSLRDRLTGLSRPDISDAARVAYIRALLQEARGLYQQADPHTMQGYEVQLLIEELEQRLLS